MNWFKRCINALGTKLANSHSSLSSMFWGSFLRGVLRIYIHQPGAFVRCIIWMYLVLTYDCCSAHFKNNCYVLYTCTCSVIIAGARSDIHSWPVIFLHLHLSPPGILSLLEFDDYQIKIIVTLFLNASSRKKVPCRDCALLRAPTAPRGSSSISVRASIIANSSHERDREGNWYSLTTLNMTWHARLFTPLLALAYATSGAWAGKKMFNIHDDLLAHPQVCSRST